MTVIAIDPGNEESAFVLYHPTTQRLENFGKLDNKAIRSLLARWVASSIDHLALEMIASYGMPVGAEVFETCVAIGRFLEAWGRPYTLVYRRDVKLHLCGSSKAKDANVRQALIDRFGEGQGKGKAIGTKKQPGPLFGVKADCWQALAVAVAYSDVHSAHKSQPLVGGGAG